MTNLSTWSAAFAELDKCPWPGPRPITRVDAEDHKEWLVGREKESDDFTSDVLSHSLVILAGDSGVGKSSILNVGLVPQLIADGFHPMVCNDWSSTAAALEDPEEFIAGKVRSQLPSDIDLDGLMSRGLCGQLDAQYGEQAVLILDQFEELIRYQPVLFHKVLEWIIEVSRDRRLRLVLSLRSEYEHRLGPLKQVGPFKMTRTTLKPLQGDESMRAVIRSPQNRSASTITDPAVDAVMIAWEAAEGGRPWSDLGLLHLQATLYALHHRAGGKCVELSHVERMIKDAVEKGGGLFELGLKEAVSLKLERCVAACAAGHDGTGLDPVLIAGTKAVVQRMIGQLSSGGYKLVHEQWNLAEKVLGREINVLDLEPIARPLFAALSGLCGQTDAGSDLLVLARSAIEVIPSGPPSDPRDDSPIAHLAVDLRPWETDPKGLTSGPMLGMRPQSVLIEEFRRFLFAVVWLREASLVRVTSPATGQTMISLIHDGFGKALEEWADESKVSPAEALNLLTAGRGESYVWQNDRSDRPVFPEFDGGIGHRTIANVRWRDCLISASFRSVVFVNCDFRGSRFEECGFCGVVFVNCLLDGVTFGDCTIYGEASAPVEHLETDLPSFVIKNADELVRTLNRYRETDWRGTELFSDTSGVPALPLATAQGNAASDPRVVEWLPQTGGLTMYGGRLSSLMVRHCSFDATGTLAFRHIAGSSLELAEQSTGRLEIYNAAIRGISITRPVDEADVVPGNISVRVRESVIANAWFGGGLTGSANFTHSVLWQLVNTSDNSNFDVTTSSCGYYGLVNVSPPEGTEEPGFAVESFEARQSVAKIASRMDYRSTPAKLELRMRGERGQ